MFAIGLGFLVYVVGLAIMAIAKGRSSGWALTAFMSILGLFIVLLLRDESPSGEGNEAHWFIT